MQDLGTQYLESVNGSIATKITKRCDFKTSHWARAQIAIMNRVLPCGPSGVANRIRERLRLPPLPPQSVKKAEAHERKNMRVVHGQTHATQEQKKKRTVQHYKTKEATSARIAEYKEKHEASAAANPINPYGLGTHGVASVRARLDAASRGEGAREDHEDDDDNDTTRTGGKGKSKSGDRKRKRTPNARGAHVMPEYTAAGSNTGKEEDLASEVRMGGRPSGGACSACIEANVGREFLVERRHVRMGKNICPRIRREWQQFVQRVRHNSPSRQELC